jgi:hypothetical protein
MRSALRIGVVLLVALLALPAWTLTASAEHSQYGPVRGTGTPFMASADGTLTFTTLSQLAEADSDHVIDVYQGSPLETVLMSTGPGDSNTHAATPAAASEDGSRVIFETPERLTPDDAEIAFAAVDVYERSGNETTLLSTSPLAGGPGTRNAAFAGATPNARYVYFLTSEHLVAGDEDACAGSPDPLPCEDLYQRVDGTTTLISTGPNEAAAADADVAFAGVSADGQRVFFETTEALIASDTDGGHRDVYERAGGQTSLVSTSASNPNQHVDATFVGTSEDGSRVFFRTQEQLTTDDTDGGFDIFQRSGGQTTKVTTGTLDSNTGAHATFAGLTPDGAHVFFDTPERLVPEDDDATGGDLYRRSGTQTTLISTGPQAVTAPSAFRAASDDGQRVIFSSTGRFTSSDTDTRIDLYERNEGATAHLSPGNGDVDSTYSARFGAASRPDARRVVFETRDSILPEDTNGRIDVYERVDGQFYRLAAPFDPEEDGGLFAAASQDLSSIFFFGSRFFGGPIYRAQLPGAFAPYPRPRHAASLSVSLVPAFEECTAPNREHGPPLAFGSCNPAQLASDYLTFGTMDSNGRPANGVGSVRAGVVAGNQATAPDEADVRLRVTLTDVRLAADVDEDYAGTLRAAVPIQVTDRDNVPAPSLANQATGQATHFGFDVGCTVTPDASVGATCATTTSADAVVPGVIKEGKRAVWELGQVQVFDGGADSDAASTGDNTLFAVQGVFVP